MARGWQRAGLWVDDRRGNPVPNPLFSDLQGTGKPARHRSLVILAGIVGVPWQDLATSDSLRDPERLTYLTPERLLATGRWGVILGDPAKQIRPSDDRPRPSRAHRALNQSS